MFEFLKLKPKKAPAVPAAEENSESLPDEKKSQSEIQTRRTNYVLVALGLAMLAVFVVGINLASKNKGQADEIKKLATAAEGAVDADEIKKEVIQTFTYVNPVLSTNPAQIALPNAHVGEESFQAILLSVANTPIKILDISPSTPIDGLAIDNTCTVKESITPEVGCTINLFWTPSKSGNMNIFLQVEYNDPEGEAGKNDRDNRGKVRQFQIPVSLSAQAQAQAEDAPEEDEFYDEEFYEEEEDIEEAEPEPAAAAPAKSERTVYPDDCKKYASKAYDFSGMFIGWVQSNNDVFAPNCSKIVGVLQEDGMVLETGTGKILGKGMVRNKKLADEKRLSLVLPELAGVMAAQGANDFNPSFDEVWSNRIAVKVDGVLPPRDPPANPDGSAGDRYKAVDPLGIISKQKNAMVPFTIMDEKQVSSGPKDERYVLRRAKPIPAVLARPLYFNGASGSDLISDKAGTGFENWAVDSVAVVERNVYGSDGRTIIIPAGSQLIGQATPPENAGVNQIEKINIEWLRIIRPDGAEFNLETGGISSWSADAQGRSGVPGKNDTEYMRQLITNPLLYSVLPVAMEALFPSTSSFVNRVRRSDGTYQVLDTDEEGFNALNSEKSGDESLTDYAYGLNDTITDVTLSSKDKMKLEVQQNWKSVATKLMEQTMKRGIPFTVPAGTRIMVFLQDDVMLRIDENMEGMFGGSQYEGGGG
ncbi:MAG: hypothetical protein LBO78_03750 [Rickettsiales bacterium]|jgi:hypothetical protein|nr:hypothetical protein [Rickettsiales bacterium]